MASNTTTESCQGKKKPILISIYAEKGGVGKTTLTITIAHLIAEQNKRVLIYDCDPQRSLTASVFYKKINNEFKGDVNAFVTSTNNPELKNQTFTFYDQFKSGKIKPAIVREVKPNLYVIPGKREINTLVKSLIMTEVLCRFNLYMDNISSGKPYLAIMKTAEAHNIDYVLIDLNPNSTDLNRCLVMTSDYLIVPLLAEFFSAEMLKCMKTKLIEWYDTMQEVKKYTQHTEFPLPNINVKFLGCIISRLLPKVEMKKMKNGLTQNTYNEIEQKWIDEITQLANDIALLADSRNKDEAPLSVSKEVYEHVQRKPILGYVKEYPSLKNISEIFQVSSSPTKKRKRTCKTESANEFKHVFKEVVKTILMIIDEDQKSKK